MGIGGGTLEETESANVDSYTPLVSANWVSPAPVTVQQALDRLAAAISANGVTPIP